MPGRGMPEAATVEGIGAHAGRTVTLRGWLAGRRSSGKLHFLQVRDGTGTIQCVMAKAEVPAEVFALADHLPQEASLVVTGTVRADARSPIGYELGVSDLQVVHQSADYPITPKEHGPAFLLDHRHLWLRSSRQHALLRVRSEVIRACREYLDGHGFLAFDAPILTPAACEGAASPSCAPSVAICYRSSACRSPSRASPTPRRSTSCARKASRSSGAPISAATRRRRSRRSSTAR